MSFLIELHKFVLLLSIYLHYQYTETFSKPQPSIFLYATCLSNIRTRYGHMRNGQCDMVDLTCTSYLLLHKITILMTLLS